MEIDKSKVAVILAGGLGSRLGNLTKKIPKPLIKVGTKPIILHILEIYLKFGINNFILAIGYKGNEIVKYFTSRKIYFKKKLIIKKKINNKFCQITLVKTGINTMTGGRIKRLKNEINSENFFLTYGDGVSNVNLKKLENFHFKHGKLVTVTAVHPIPRFGEIDIHKNRVTRFSEKKRSTKIWINGGFFILNKKFLRYIKNDSTILEREPLEKAAKKKQMFAFKHRGFWQCMDTKRDKDLLSNLLKKIKPW